MRIIFLATLMIFSCSASAGLYKIVDSEGNVTYQQKPPRNMQYKRIKPPARAPESSKPLYKSSNKDIKAKNVVANEVAKNKKLRAEACENAKKNLKTYTLYRRVRDKSGKVTPIDDKERAKQLKNAKESISELCE